MRLTVGPLPAAVYWRRRAVVLVAASLVIVAVSVVVGGSTGTRQATVPTSAPTVAVGSTSQAGGPSSAAVVDTGPCTDVELELTAAASMSTVGSGQPVAFTIRIRNMSSRSCVRDIGADLQELRLLDESKIIWSSDDCGANTGHDLRRLAALSQVSFTLTWTGRRSRSGVGTPTCRAGLPDAGPVAPGRYQLVARLDQLFSAPYPLIVTT